MSGPNLPLLYCHSKDQEQDKNVSQASFFLAFTDCINIYLEVGKIIFKK